MEKKNKIILIAVVCVIIIAAALFVSGIFNKNVYLRITNQSDGDLYKYWIYYSYQGKVFPDIDGAIGTEKHSGVGDNTRQPFVVGESAKLNMKPNPNYTTGKPENLTIELYVFDKPIKTGEDGKIENGVKVGEAFTFPVEIGKCAELVITGNREAGFKMEVTGYSNWLFH